MNNQSVHPGPSTSRRVKSERRIKVGDGKDVKVCGLQVPTIGDSLDEGKVGGFIMKSEDGSKVKWKNSKNRECKVGENFSVSGCEAISPGLTRRKGSAPILMNGGPVNSKISTFSNQRIKVQIGNETTLEQLDVEHLKHKSERKVAEKYSVEPILQKQSDSAQVSHAFPSIDSVKKPRRFFNILKIFRWNKVENNDDIAKNLFSQNCCESLQNQSNKNIKNEESMKYDLKNYVFDEKNEIYYYWLGIVSCAFAYNLVGVIARIVFSDLVAGMLWIIWIFFDIVTDVIYVLDMIVHSRTGFLEQGLLVRDISRIRKLYLKSNQFKFDLISVLPLDHAAYVIKFKQYPFLRLNRLIRYPRFSNFVERTETRTSMPNAFRVFCVVLNIIIIIHWNACIYFYISDLIGIGSDGWVYGPLNKQSLPDGVEDTLARRYIYSFYWSTLILTTIGEVPGPVKNIEFVFVIMDLMCGVLIFATIVGNVGSMISNMNAARTEFQSKMDGIKQYMELRKVSKQLEERVIKWFDYLWTNKQSLSDQQVLKVLPDKLQAEIAMQVHFETLRKVRIFQDCEAGLLVELVLKLQQQVFSPGDYICRKGDIGREMYIVKRGKLQVVADDGTTVFVTLQEGAVFGELSILNIAGSKNGNRRTANVRSVGYTELFALNKNDLWNALKEYPDARKLLIAKGREILRKDGLLDENAPDEQMSVEEMVDDLQNMLKNSQTRMARFVAELTSTKVKLHNRIANIESVLSKCNIDLDD